MGAARGIAGASGGAYLGRRGGEELGRLVGAPEVGGKVGGVLGSIAGGYGAVKSPEMIEGYLGRLLGKPTPGIGTVGSAAQEAGYEPPVMKIPEPKGPKVIRAEQVPGPDTAGKGNLLTPAARRGEEGAGAELMGRGRSVLYTVPEYEGTAPKMKMTFPPNASGESEASLEAINRGKAEKLGGIKRFAVDSRSGVRRRVYGADQTPNPYEHIIRSGPDGEFIETSGTKARPYNPQ
jgi:hypothetical protein